MREVSAARSCTTSAGRGPSTDPWTQSLALAWHRALTVTVLCCVVLWASAALGAAPRGPGAPEQEEDPGASAARVAVQVEVEVLGEGLFGALESNIEATLGVAAANRKGARRELTLPRLRRLHAEAEEEIAAALEPFGYYRPEVQASLKPPEGSREKWVARYVVDPGPQLLLSAVDIKVTGTGAEQVGFRRLVEQFPLRPGSPLLHTAYEEGKEALRRYATTNGYLDAVFEASRIEVDLDAYDARIQLRLSTGPRYLFGETTFVQNVLDADVLQGYVTTTPGEPFDYEELLHLQEVLSDSPYFRRIEVQADRESALDLHVPIDVTLVPAAAQKWDLGLGYGTDTGPRGTIDLDLRRINRRGHRGAVSTLASEIERSVSGRYLIPGAYPRTDVLTFTLGYRLLEPDTSRSETLLAGIGRTRSIGRWREAIGLVYQRADFEVGSDSGISELLVPEIGYSRVKSDDRIFTTHGRRLSFKLRGALEDIGSDATFAQTTAETKVIRSFGRQLRLIGRLQAGYTVTDDFRDLPPEMRFFAGGDESVRGYGYQDIGPLDEEQNVIGGEALLTGGLEIESMFLEFERFGRWGAAAFYDFGSAANDLAEDLQQGVGLGLRWLSPIGLVRADVAWATSLAGTPLRFHLMIGPDL